MALFSRLCALILISALFSGRAAESAAPSPDEQKLALANEQFGLKLLSQLAKAEPGANIFISPHSIATALDMVAAGAAGQTKTEMDKVLGTVGQSAAAIANDYTAIDHGLQASASNAILTIANSVWFAPFVQLKPDFLSLNEQYYRAKVGPLDFTDPRASGIVNRWVSENTHGKIEKLVEGPLSGMTGAFIANAIYFKGTWQDKFDVKQTRTRPFHLQAAATKDVPLMQRHAEFQYKASDAFQAVWLPYQGRRLGMYVFLPATNSTVEKMLTGLAHKFWEGFGETPGTLALPKFTLAFRAELKEHLNELGMKKPFVAGVADFSGISTTPLYISSVVHKSFVEVNEEGTEAAAATGITMNATAVHKPRAPFEMIVDRPFLFLIQDRITRAPLFVGIVNTP